MTQDDINELARCHRSRDEAKIEYNAKIQRINDYIQTIYARCDHIHPDGRSSIVSGPTCSACVICYWSDL
jgi:hypothetical protein